MPTGSAERRRAGPAREIEVEIHDLAAGGAGVGRLPDGRVAFVDGALPGDRVLASLRKEKPRFVQGESLQILRPSPQRVSPPCPLADTCGGCPWMGLSYDAQLAAKERMVAESLARLGGVDRGRISSIVAAPATLGYRGRARLLADGLSLGFRARRGDAVVDVSRCLVLTPGMGAALSEIRRIITPALPLTTPLQVELDEREDEAAAVTAALSGAPVRELRRERLPGWITLHDGEAGAERHLPFAQANARVNVALRAQVLQACAPAPGRRILDVYCGAGNFAAPLAAEGAEVLGIELAEDAVAQARRRIPPPARFVAGDAAAVLRGEEGRWDAAVLDPPRAGAAEVVPELLRLGPARIVYVSCDPATLGRDLRALGERYEVIEVSPYDMMPHTAHVEAVAVLDRRG